MTRQVINVGSSANDGTGDSLRTAGGKINDMTDEIYTALDSLGNAIPGETVVPITVNNDNQNYSTAGKAGLITLNLTINGDSTQSLTLPDQPELGQRVRIRAIGFGGGAARCQIVTKFGHIFRGNSSFLTYLNEVDDLLTLEARLTNGINAIWEVVSATDDVILFNDTIVSYMRHVALNDEYQFVPLADANDGSQMDVRSSRVNIGDNGGLTGPISVIPEFQAIPVGYYQVYQGSLQTVTLTAIVNPDRSSTGDLAMSTNSTLGVIDVNGVAVLLYKALL